MLGGVRARYRSTMSSDTRWSGTWSSDIMPSNFVGSVNTLTLRRASARRNGSEPVRLVFKKMLINMKPRAATRRYSSDVRVRRSRARAVVRRQRRLLLLCDALPGVFRLQTLDLGPRELPAMQHDSVSQDHRPIARNGHGLPTGVDG